MIFTTLVSMTSVVFTSRGSLTKKLHLGTLIKKNLRHDRKTGHYLN
jgi:hypothetical protein